MKKTGLAMDLFGKKQSELTPEELKLYYREAKRRYIKSPEAVEKKKQRGKVWRETHREEAREYARQYRKSGKALDYTKLYKRALELACEEIDANSKGLTNARFKIQKIVNDWCIGEQMSIFDFFLQQAKKELEEQN